MRASLLRRCFFGGWRRGEPGLWVWRPVENLAQTHFDVKHGIKSKCVAPRGMPGVILSLSAYGDRNGILWAALPLKDDAWVTVVRGVLRAFDATTLTELWSTDQYEPDDDFNYAKFCPPTIANGKVYLPTFSDRLNVYGPLPPAALTVKAVQKAPRISHQHPSRHKTVH